MNRDFKIIQLKKISLKVAHEIFQIMKQHVPNLKPLSVKYLKKLLDNRSIKIFTALNDRQQIIGIITMVSYFKVDGLHKIFIEDFVVNSADRRKGIGLALTKKVLTTAKKIGVNTVHLTSHPSRLEANILYKKIGFKIYETNYYKYQLKNN